MFDFIRKKMLWNILDEGLHKEIDAKISYQLKTAQDLAIYSLLRDEKELSIGEIGGGDSRILNQLAKKNQCTNIEKFEGADCGPNKEIIIDNVTNIHARVGDFDLKLEQKHFDVIFSISVVEHIESQYLDAFHRDIMRILKPGGRFYHAIDVYLTNDPSDYHINRVNEYRSWLENDPRISALEKAYKGPVLFNCNMVSNPDNTMYDWGKLNANLTGLRKEAQLVSLLVGGKKED